MLQFVILMRCFVAFHPNESAMFLAKKALTYSLDTKRDGPFAVNSKKAGHLFLGLNRIH
jgi:hypothetical protein